MKSEQEEGKSLLQSIADALGCKYGHVRNVVSGQTKAQTKLNEQILVMYSAKKAEELKSLNRQIARMLKQIKHNATHDIELANSNPR